MRGSRSPEQSSTAYASRRSLSRAAVPGQRYLERSWAVEGAGGFAFPLAQQFGGGVRARLYVRPELLTRKTWVRKAWLRSLARSRSEQTLLLAIRRGGQERFAVPIRRIFRQDPRACVKGRSLS